MTEAARAALSQGCAIWANPSSPHAEGRTAKRALEDARAAVARSLGWQHEILFTSGASESLSIALTHAMAERRFVGAIDHDAVLRAALGAQGATHAAEGSLNNQWGVPLSLARMPRTSRFAVFEIGMNHAGEITPLSQIVRPHVAVVTTVEAVHVENFPDRGVEGIAEAKAEIFAGAAGGTPARFEYCVVSSAELPLTIGSGSPLYIWRVTFWALVSRTACPTGWTIVLFTSWAL